MKYIVILSVIFFIYGCDILPIKPSVDKECDYIIPTEWNLSQNKIGKWAITNSYKGVLGYSVRYHTYDFYSYDSNSAMIFDDSCSAKGLAKQYLDFVNKNKFR